jgi:transposase InsO family protein
VEDPGAVTREGKVYCYVVIDVFSRRVVGWAIDTAQRSDLDTNALGMAIDSSRPSPGAIPSSWRRWAWW